MFFMSVSKKWSCALSMIEEEISHSDIPLESTTYLKHVSSLSKILIKLIGLENKLKYQLNIYVLLLREVGKAIRKNERAYGLAIIRYLRLVWLNQFKDIINYEMNNFNKTPQPF